MKAYKMNQQQAYCGALSLTFSLQEGGTVVDDKHEERHKNNIEIKWNNRDHDEVSCYSYQETICDAFKGASVVGKKQLELDKIRVESIISMITAVHNIPDSVVESQLKSSLSFPRLLENAATQ